MEQKRLQELKLCIGDLTAWLDFMQHEVVSPSRYAYAKSKIDKMLSLIDSAMQPVSSSQMVMDSDMCDHLGAILYQLDNAEMDGIKTVTIETKELRLMVDDYTALIKETSAERERKFIAMQQPSAECERAIENISARYAKTLEEGKANSLAIQALKQMQEPKPCEWINVKDRLPETYEDVLCRTKDKCVFVWYLNENGNWENREVTHWMPLPEQPKE